MMNANFFAEQVDSLPQLTPLQLKKLKHLTIVSLAAKNRVSSYLQLWRLLLNSILILHAMQSIPYSTLQEELEIRDLRELEDLIIEAIYAGIIQAKLDQKNAKVSTVPLHFLQHMALHLLGLQLEVECFIGRDIKMESIPDMVKKLENW